MAAYVDRRVVDFAAAEHAARDAARRLALSTPILIRHGMNAIYRCGDVILRVATPNAPAGVSIALASWLRDAGVPVAAPVSDVVVESRGHSVTAWQHVESRGGPIDWREVGRAVRLVQSLSVHDVPDGVPLPSPVEFPWWDHERLLGEVDEFLDPDARRGLGEAIDRHRRWRVLARTAPVLCHGDVHPGNVVMSADGPVLVDWDLLCVAPAGWDHAPMMSWTSHWGGAPGEYAAMAEGAGWSARGDPASEAFCELRLVSATLMRIKVALADQNAVGEARRRLEYWRGDPAPAIWSAQ